MSCSTSVWILQQVQLPAKAPAAMITLTAAWAMHRDPNMMVDLFLQAIADCMGTPSPAPQAVDIHIAN